MEIIARVKDGITLDEIGGTTVVLVKNALKKKFGNSYMNKLYKSLII